MKLSELHPQLLKRTDRGVCDFVDTLELADGIFFLCPTCFETNGGERGTHAVICWRPRVPAGVTPGPGRWEFNGTGLADLTLVAASSSVKLTSTCGAHFFIRLGEIVKT